MLYKGYIETKGKAAVEKFKNKTRFKTYEQVKDLPGFGGVLENDTILIDIDDYEQSEIMMDIVSCTGSCDWLDGCQFRTGYLQRR